MYVRVLFYLYTVYINTPQLLKGMPTYFIGNVLSPTNTQPEQDDPTFAFTREEAANLDLTDKPIRMEHHSELEVGKITRHWQQEDGSVWVVGKLDEDGFQSKFAKHAITKDPETGASYYTGLSLQHCHTQYASEGSSKKEAIEVSLCVNPRRSDCRIAFVNSDPNKEEREKVTYKIHSASFNKNDMSEISQEPAQNTAPAEATEVEKIESSDTSNMTNEQYMRVIVEQEEKLEALKTAQSKEMEELRAYKESISVQKSNELEELRALKEEIEKQKAAEVESTRKKNLAYWKAIKEMDPEAMAELDDASQTAIKTLSDTHPNEARALLHVAHCASKKTKDITSQFNDYREMMKRNQLQQRFESVMSKKRPAEEPRVQEVVHAASKRARVVPTQEQSVNRVTKFLETMKKYNTSGSARDHMDAVSKIGVRRNVPRAPYY